MKPEQLFDRAVEAQSDQVKGRTKHGLKSRHLLREEISTAQPVTDALMMAIWPRRNPDAMLRCSDVVNSFGAFQRNRVQADSRFLYVSLQSGGIGICRLNVMISFKRGLKYLLLFVFTPLQDLFAFIMAVPTILALGLEDGKADSEVA